MKTVLIADDQLTLRRLVSATLASDQYAVLEASDGDEAWALIQRHRPAVAVLDVQMPGRDGLELTRAIKGTPELAHIHVVLLTAQTSSSDIEVGLAAGADRYLTKPFSPLKLLSMVEEIFAID